MKDWFLLLTILYLFYSGTKAQEKTEYFKTTVINKKIIEYADEFNLTTPLKSFITFNYLYANGKAGLLRQASSATIKGFMPKSGAPDLKRPDEMRNEIMNSIIKEMIVFKDSIACIISGGADSLYSMRYFFRENGFWRNTGEDLAKGLTGARNRFTAKSAIMLSRLRRVCEFQKMPKDTAVFIQYLKEHGKDPKTFILNSLKEHKIVIYGEVHLRKTSWDLLKAVIKAPGFYKTAGTVFMEISSDAQSKLDNFFNNRELNTGIILDVFRNLELTGWMDRGMYEFLIELWKINNALPEKDRIKVVAADIPVSYDLFLTKKQHDDHFNSMPGRNRQMADVIENFVNSDNRGKNNLFIVGLAHAYKSAAPSFDSGNIPENQNLTAAALLSKKFSNSSVFSIFTHCPIIGNDGSLHGRKRNGLFDYVFHKLKNIPAGFNLKSSPFGKEPCDAVFEIMYHPNTGNYENNYDAYIFLEPLDEEPGEYFLFDLFSDDFIKELKRRAAMVGMEKIFKCDLNNLTRESITAALNTKINRWDLSE